MNTNDGASQPASQTKDTSTPPFSGTGVPAFNYAIAVQQYQFQQSLLSQQLLAQHNAAAHAVSIKAAAEQAVARAAEISKLLDSSKDDAPKEKVDEPSPKREISESKSHSRSQSRSRSSKSKSKSASPIRHRNSRTEYRQYSPRGHRNYRSRRTSPYYRRGYYDRGGFTRSSYRRDVGRSHGRHYSRRSRSTSRSRRRSPSRFRSLRYHHGQSRSPIRRHRFRSPSPKSDQRMPVRDSNRHNMSKSPINSSSISSSPQRSRIRIPKKLNARRSLSISGNSQSLSSSENSDASDLDVKRSEKEATPSRGHFIKSDRSNSLSRSGNTSSDYSSRKGTLEPSINQAVSGKLTYTDRGHSSSSRSLDEGSVPHRASDASDDESYPVLSNNIDHPMHVLGQHSSNSDETFDDRHDGKGFMKNEDKKKRDSVVSRNHDHMKPRSFNSRSLSRENSFSDHADEKKYSDERKGNADANKVVVKEIHPFELNLRKSFKSNNRSENELPLKSISRKEESAYYPDAGMDKRMEEKIDHWNLSKDVENSINDNIHNMDGKMMLQKTLDEHKHKEEYDSGAPIVLQDEFASVDAEQVSGSPATVCQYPQERSKHRSKSREKRRKHSRRHRKRRKGEVSEEDDDYIKDSESERKSKRNERKDHRRHHKSRKEKKRRKRKYRDTPSSSYEESSSSDDEDRIECYDVPRKRSNGSRKIRGSGPTAVTSSS